MTHTTNQMTVAFSVPRKLIESAKLEVHKFNKQQELRNEVAKAFSPSIKFEMFGENFEFEYKGDRVAFHKSGGIDFVMKFFGGVEKATKAIASYISEDRALRWNETKFLYMVLRAPVDESIKYLKEEGKDPVKFLENRIPADVLLMLGRNHRQVQAALTKDEMVIWQALSKAKAVEEETV